MIRANDSDSGLSQGVDLTPLIDIIFIVLVFLLLTANVQLLTLPVDVPEQNDAQMNSLQDPKSIAISIVTQAPYYAIDHQKFEQWDSFKAAFLARHQNQPEAVVIVAADQDAPIQPLMKLLALLQAQQIDQTQIVMEETQ